MPVTVGHRFPEKQVVLERARVEEYVEALGVAPEPDWEPVDGAPLPPGFLMYVTTYGADPVHDALGFDRRAMVYGGMDAEFLHPVRVGDTVTVTPVVSKLFTKPGKQGELTFVELTCEYRRPDGEVAVRERSTVVHRGAVDG